MSEETNGAAPAAAEAKPSLDDTLSAAYDRIMARDAEPEREREQEKPVEAEKPSGDRARGPDGKFVAKEAAAQEALADKTETPPAVEAKPAAPAEAEKPSAPADQAEKVLIPKTWQNDKRRDLFIKAPPEVQRALAEREAETEQGVAKLQQRYSQYEQLVSPIRQQLAIEGRSPEQYLGALMAADNMLRTNPMHGIAQIARMYGVDLGAVTQQAPQQDMGNPLHAELMTLKQQLEEIKAQPIKMAEAEAGQQIEQFAADPANRFFPQVRALMSSILQSGAATSLKDAYELATSAHPEIRKTLEAEKAAQAQAAQAEAAKRAAIEAQRSAAMNAATRGGVGATSTARGTWQQTLERTADRLFS